MDSIMNDFIDLTLQQANDMRYSKGDELLGKRFNSIILVPADTTACPDYPDLKFRNMDMLLVDYKKIIGKIYGGDVLWLNRFNLVTIDCLDSGLIRVHLRQYIEITEEIKRDFMLYSSTQLSGKDFK